MLDSKIVSCTATADAVQETPMLGSKIVSRTATADARQETPMLDSKIVSCTAIVAAVPQIDFPRSNNVLYGRAFFDNPIMRPVGRRLW